VFDTSVEGCLYGQYPCKLFCGSGFPGASLAVGRKTSSYAGIIQLLFLIGHLSLIGVWFGEDQRANTIKTHV